MGWGSLGGMGGTPDAVTPATGGNYPAGPSSIRTATRAFQCRGAITAGCGNVLSVIAISSLLLVAALSLVVTRAATVLLVATGLSSPVARFQARSALTGSGFTTRESESVVNHPLRRRVIMALMLLGNLGLVASAGTLILGFSGGGGSKDWARIVELVVGLLVIVIVSRSSVVDSWLTAAAARLLRRYTEPSNRDLGGLLQLAGSYSVKELAVQPGDWIADRALGDVGLRDEGVVVLGVTRADGHYIGAPSGSTVLRPGDLLVVYGRDESLASLDERRHGPHGDAEHELATDRQTQREAEEESAARR